MIYHGSGVEATAHSVPWTPTIAASSGSGTVTTNLALAYRFGQMVYIYLDFTITAVGTATGSVLVYTPTICVTGGMICGVKNPAAASPITVLGYLIENSTTISTVDYTNASLWVNGVRVTMQGWYTEFFL